MAFLVNVVVGKLLFQIMIINWE